MIALRVGRKENPMPGKKKWRKRCTHEGPDGKCPDDAHYGKRKPPVLCKTHYMAALRAGKIKGANTSLLARVQALEQDHLYFKKVLRRMEKLLPLLEDAFTT